MPRPDSETANEALISQTRGSRIATIFRDRRIALGRELSEVAASVGIESESVLALYENGTIPIPLVHVYWLTQILEISCEEILGIVYDAPVASGERMNALD